ncbi:putative LOC100569746 [Trichonephila clavipes]|nr:putative LOC100569746 [Trichonephila clavipes]
MYLLSYARSYCCHNVLLKRKFQQKAKFGNSEVHESISWKHIIAFITDCNVHRIQPIDMKFGSGRGHNVTINGDRYRAIITNFFIPELNNHDVQELWFQQDSATCHIARATIDLLKDTFGDRLISRFGPVNWPPRSCDLTQLDYFLWGYVKSLVYADKPQTLDHLEDNIRRVIADIRPQMLEKVIENWTTSEPAVAVLCQKSYLKCNATRLSFE